MKKYLLFVVVIAVITGCSKKEVNNDNPIDIFNGYGHLKSSAPTETLYAGQTINVGTVTYGIDDAGNFTATYNLTGGWEMSESHFFAGDFDDMPLNKPGNPQIGHFPYAADHSPWVTTYTYTIPCTDLPPADGDGFTTAAHCIVHGPNGQTETAWRGGDDAIDFPGKRWGWYDTFYLDDENVENHPTVLFGTQYGEDGTLDVYLINVTSGTTTHLVSDEIGYDEISFDGTAFDTESGYFFFVGTASNTLYGINMNSESVLETLGTLPAPTQSATYNDGNYYYVDGNNLMAVTFDSDMQISDPTQVGTIPAEYNILSITGITMDVNTNTMYMLGNVNDGSTSLISMDILNTSNTSATSTTLNQNSQLAFGTDNVLYVIEASDDGSGSVVGTIDATSGTITYANDNATEEVADPFSDLAGGPMM